jgi:arabinofuranan 3-O-arabinosyltransferase
VLPVAIVLAAMLLRQLARRALPVVVFGGLTLATVTAVAGRLRGHGQEWAYGTWVQAAMLVAIGAVVAAVVPVPGAPPTPDAAGPTPDVGPPREDAEGAVGGAAPERVTAPGIGDPPIAGEDEDGTVVR